MIKIGPKNKLLKSVLMSGLISVLFLLTSLSSGQVYNPSDDSYVRGGSSAGINYGNETVLVVKKGSVADFYRKAYLKFELAGIGITGLQSAKLRLYAASGDALPVTVYETTDNWKESNISWSNAPAIGNILGTVQVNSNGSYFEWDITSYVQSQIEGDETVSLACYDASSTNKQVSFSSKEAAANMPELVMVSEASFLPPKAPSGLVATAVSWKQINLNWTDSSNNERIFIIERKSGSGSFDVIDTIPSNTNHYSDTGLTETTRYTYRIFAVNDIGFSLFSNEFTIQTKAFVSPPMVPGTLSGLSEAQWLELYWSDNSSDEDGFVIARKPQDGFYIEVGWPVANSTEFTSLVVQGKLSPVVDPDSFLVPRFNRVNTISGIKFTEVTDYKGRKISLYMDIYQPEDDVSRNRPVIMFIHGGGFRTGSTRTQSYIVRYCQEFAKRGYVCVSIDYRLRDGSDMPTQASEFPALQDAVRDANTALEWLRDNALEYGFDPNLVFLAGGSSGGRIAITEAYFDGPDDLDPSVSWDKSGIIALIDLWGSLEPEMRGWAFPVNELDIPTCIIHGTADSTILYQNSLDLAAELSRADVSFELHPINGAGHTPTGSSTDPSIIKWMAEFYVKEWKKHVSEIRTYSYRVCSYNEGGNSAWSNEVTLTLPFVNVDVQSYKTNFKAGGSKVLLVLNQDKSIDLFFPGSAPPANSIVNLFNLQGQKIPARVEMMGDRIRIYPHGINLPQMYLISLNSQAYFYTGKVLNN